MAPSDTKDKIHALLYALGRPLAHAELAKMLSLSEAEVAAALGELAAESGPVRVVDDGREAELRVAGAQSTLVERVRKEEFDQSIGKAGLEVLSAILYRGPLTRAEIDFIRGVNSTQTLRTLTMRGLVRRVQNPRDERSYLYEPTTELLSTLGVGHVHELPEYAQVRAKLTELEDAYRAKQSHDHDNA